MLRIIITNTDVTVVTSNNITNDELFILILITIYLYLHLCGAVDTELTVSCQCIENHSVHCPPVVTVSNCNTQQGKINTTHLI